MMKNTKLVLIVCIIFSSFSIYSQSNLEELSLTQHKSDYLKKAKKMGFFANVRNFYKYKIDINKYEEFKKIGVDLFNVDRAPINYFDKSFYSTSIIVGTIVERKYTPGKDNYFHTEYKVEVDDVLKGDISSRYIFVKTISGLINAEDDSFITDMGEPKLFLGEKGMFMLDKIDFEAFEAFKKQSGEISEKINANENHFKMYWKFPIRDGSKVYNSSLKLIGDISEIRKKIKKIILINNSKQFEKKIF